MVIDDFSVVRVAIFPSEADAPLLINSNAVLSFAISVECFEMITGRDVKSFELGDRRDESEFVQCALLNIARKFSGKAPFEDLSRFFALEALNHLVCEITEMCDLVKFIITEMCDFECLCQSLIVATLTNGDEGPSSLPLSFLSVLGEFCGYLFVLFFVTIRVIRGRFPC